MAFSSVVIIVIAGPGHFLEWAGKAFVANFSPIGGMFKKCGDFLWREFLP